jgi:pimeloyl-ACP methyl ester carboxylesterase
MSVRITRVTHTARALGLVLLAALASMFAAAAGDKILSNVVFSHYGPASSNRELTRRLLSPAELLRIERQLAASGTVLGGYAIDLAAERFVVYVPSQAPASGYSLVVFVPPWQQAGLPEGWRAVLERNGAIFVSAARSGNDENTMGRREPLALLAAENIIAEYRVDPERVYIAGFSGGSRIALRLAVGYPDLFRGAILNAGSDSLGDPTAEPPIPLPPQDLFYQFQSGTRLVYITGERDSTRVEEDLLSMRSMREWCVFNVESIVEPLLGHDVAQPVAFSRALGSLSAGIHNDPDRLSRCRAGIDVEMEGMFQKVKSLLASGKRDAADKLLKKIDQRYGGLATARSAEFAEK